MGEKRVYHLNNPISTSFGASKAKEITRLRDGKSILSLSTFGGRYYITKTKDGQEEADIILETDSYLMAITELRMIFKAYLDELEMDEPTT